MTAGAVTLGQWVNRRRKALGLTQQELARRLPCSVVAIRKIEADKRRPSREFAERLAECLNIPPAQRSAWVGFARADAGSVHQWVWSQAFRPATNLPLPPTPLIGRAREVAALRKRLLSADTRLLTLVGPPGIGKTRLALQAAAELRDEFEGGVCFVDLSPIGDPESVALAIAKNLGLFTAKPQSPRSWLLEYLQDKQLLLLLDNFEQVVAAARLVSDLLSAAPWLKVLVTSRLALRVRRERQYHVVPLALPDLSQLPAVESLLQCPSVALFVERASAVDPAFALDAGNAAHVAALCCRLDGLPLAIELIAPRIQVLSPDMLLARLSGEFMLHSDGLRDVPDRQRTLRAAIGWSYRLLDAREQALFRRLSVFRGGWTLEAAEAVASDGPASAPEAIPPSDVLDLLAGLVRNHLVQKQGANGQPRFAMLQTSGEYARVELEASGEAALVQQRHAEFFQSLVETAEPQLTSTDALPWLERLEREHDNIRAALRWALDQRQADLALRLAGALWRFWRKRGYASEGLQWTEAALAVANAAVAVQGREDAALTVRARALVGAGVLARTVGDFARAEGLHKESLALYQTLGDRADLALALFALGADAHELGKVQTARSYYQQSLTLYQQLQDRRGTALLLEVMGGLARDQGDLAQAEASFTRVLQMQQERGESYSIAWSLLDLGDVARMRGACKRAAAQFDESLALFRELGDAETVAVALQRLGEMAASQGNYLEAQTCLEESLLLSRKMGLRTEAAAALRLMGRVALAQGNLEGADMLCEQSLELATAMGHEVSRAQALADLARVRLWQCDYDQAVALFRESSIGLVKSGCTVEIPACLEGLAQALLARGQARTAAQLLGAAKTLREAMGTPLPPACGAAHEDTIAAARAALGDDKFAATWAEGRSMSFTDALALAQTEAGG